MIFSETRNVLQALVYKTFVLYTMAYAIFFVKHKTCDKTTVIEEFGISLCLIFNVFLQ